MPGTEVKVRYVNIPVAEQRARLLGRKKSAGGERPKTTYTVVWNGNDHGITELIDIRRAGTDDEHYIGLTIRASKSSSSGMINIAMHHKFITDSSGKYIAPGKAKNLSPEEVQSALNMAVKFMAEVGTPETDPLGFYKATGLVEDVHVNALADVTAEVAE